MSARKVLADLNKGVILPCYLLCGHNEYLISETLNKILDLIIPQADRDFGLFYLEGESADFDDLIEHVLTPSLLGTRKVVVVRNTTFFASRENLAELIEKIRGNLDVYPDKAVKYFFTFMKISGFKWEDLQGDGWKRISDEQWQKIVEGDAGDNRDKWLPRILDISVNLGIAAKTGIDRAEQLGGLFSSGLPAGNCVIFTAQSVDKRKKLYKIIEEVGTVLHFEELKTESALRESFREEAQKLLADSGKYLSDAAWMALGRKTGFQPRNTLNELQKLIYFVGDRPSIEDKDVNEVVGKTKEDVIFELTAALSEKNQQAALTSLQALLNQGIHYLVIFSMIGREIRFLLQARILVASKKLPKIDNTMEYGRFQKHIYPTLQQLAKTQEAREDQLIKKHPYVIFNALRNCGRFSYPALVSLLDELVEIDRAMKSSAAEPKILLENFLVKACAKAS